MINSKNFKVIQKTKNDFGYIKCYYEAVLFLGLIQFIAQIMKMKRMGTSGYVLSLYLHNISLAEA